MAQKLSPKAAKAKAKRDLAYAKTSSRKKKKSLTENTGPPGDSAAAV